MNVTAELDEMRVGLKGCTLVAFTDLSSSLVLSTSAASKPVQEELNALGRTASLTLNGELSEGAAKVWSESGDVPAETAMLLTGSEARVFLRAASNPNEALVCICAPGIALDAVIDSGLATLDRIQSQSG